MYKPIIKGFGFAVGMAYMGVAFAEPRKMSGHLDKAQSCATIVSSMANTIGSSALIHEVQFAENSFANFDTYFSAFRDQKFSLK